MGKILVIQDSPSVSMMMKFRLEGANFSVDTAETGEEGLDKAKAGEYDLILLDYNLPGINGAEVCHELKDKENTSAVPVVIVSASEEPVISELVTKAHADGYITMPFEGEEFIVKVNSFIKDRG